MKISSRSILSPGRAGYSREPQPLTLSTSLSRRLSNSRSIKGAASPAMFPVTGKKRGCGFDNPEPSSPKVTCIGQVRIKTKKKNIRSSSRRRKLERSHSQSQHFLCPPAQRNNNQGWVHIPLTICETLRTLGSEVSCLFPCRSSTEHEDKTDEERKHGSCGAVVERWLVALQDGDGGRGEIELVARDNENDDSEMDVKVSRRHVFDNLEIVDDVILGSKDEAGVSICVPPKNALLLMRCRSDPVKMEALTNRFWEPTLKVNEEKDEERVMVLDEIDGQEHAQDSEEINLEIEMKQSIQEEEDEQDQEHKQDKEEINLEIEMKQSVQEEDEQDQEHGQDDEEIILETEMKKNMETNEGEEDGFFLGSLFEENADEAQELKEEEDSDMEDAHEELLEDEDEIVQDIETGESNIEKLKQVGEEVETGKSNIEKVKNLEEEIVEMLTEGTERSEIPEETYEDIEAGELNIETVERINEEVEEMLTEFTERSGILDETYEEVEAGESNIGKVQQFEEETETGESNIEKVKQFEEGNDQMLTEFTEELFEDEDVQEPETGESNKENHRQFEAEDVQEIETGDSNIEKVKQFEQMLTEFTEDIKVENGENEEREKIEALPMCLLLMMYEPKLSMDVSNEKKVMNTIGLEPLALTRCKSEPMRTARDSCGWQNQLEPPRRASFGVGLTGLGYCQFGS